MNVNQDIRHGVDQDIRDGIKAAQEYAERLPAVLGEAHAAASAQDCGEKLCLIWRMATELRRQTDSLQALIAKREAGR